MNFEDYKMYVSLSIVQAKKEMYDVKKQRLCLAQDEYKHLNNALSTLAASRTSCKYIQTIANPIIK